jgi:tetratricopeptide (TPR) repeat protein
LAAETSILLGWLTYDQGDEQTAHNYYRSALTAAAEAGDTYLGAYAIGSASVLPAWRSSPEDSIHLLTDATIHGFSVDDASPHTRAWIYSLEAEAYTRAKDEAGALGAIDKAQAVLDRAGRELPDSRTVFFDENRLLGERGVTAVRLGRDADGQAVLERVLDEMHRDHKIRSRLLTSLAKAHVRHGSIDQAVDITLRSLDIAIRTGTASSYDDVVKLRPEFDRWAHTEPVQRLDEALRAS